MVKCFVSELEEYETRFLSEMKDLLNVTSETYLKNMRRILPISKQKYEWSLKALELNKNLHFD